MPGKPPGVLFEAVGECFDTEGEGAGGMVFVHVAECEEGFVRASENGFENGGQGRVHTAAKTGPFDSNQAGMARDVFRGP